MRALIDIPADSRGPRAARHVTSTVLAAWGLAELREDAALIVSELVTNACEHAPGPESFELELVRRDRGIRIWLADNSAIMPAIRELVAPDARGRGMRIVPSPGDRVGR